MNSTHHFVPRTQPDRFHLPVFIMDRIVFFAQAALPAFFGPMIITLFFYAQLQEENNPGSE